MKRTAFTVHVIDETSVTRLYIEFLLKKINLIERWGK